MRTNDFASSHHNGPATYWEEVANTRWGAYTTDIARRAVLLGHELSAMPTTALEIGCEGGRWSRLLTDLGWSMTCTDVDDEVLRLCEKRIPTAKCILAAPNDRKIPCLSNSIDLLLCIEVAPVIQSDWFLGESFRVLRGNGVMICVFWNLLSLRGLFAHTRVILSGTFDYYRLAYLSWKKRLLGAGFCTRHEEGYCWFPFRRDSNSSLVPYFTNLEQRLGLRKLSVLSPWVSFVAQKISQ